MNWYANNGLQKNIESGPSGFIDMEFPDTIEAEISRWEAMGRRYGVFPIKGDSMTCQGSQSIPEGAKVLAVEVDLTGREGLGTNSVPVKVPLLIGINHKGRQLPICKSIHAIDLVCFNYRLRSFNPRYSDFWIPMDSVFAIWKIVHVIKP